MAANYTIIGLSGVRQTVRLSAPIAAGAAGSIHRIEGIPGKVAKLYIHEKDRPLYKEKIAAMMERPPTLPPIAKNGRLYVQIAWPEAAVEDDRGHFCGFVMPEVDMQSAALLENVLQRKKRQLKGLPELYAYRVLLAANLAALMSELHGLGHHMVDMKPLNMSFYPSESSMAILDTDGFSIRGSRRFPAEQYSDEYIAPEANGKKPEELGLEQDLFALAVIIFRLLNNGIHPYQGIDAGGHPSNLQDRVFAGLYAYGIRPHSDVRPAPPSLHEKLEEKTRELFDRAFQGIASRPTAAEWRNHLTGLINEKILVVCSVNPKEHAHFSKGCGLCEVERRISNAHRAAAGSQVQMSGSVLAGLLNSGTGAKSAPMPIRMTNPAAQTLPSSKPKPVALAMPWRSKWPLIALGCGLFLVVLFAIYSAFGDEGFGSPDSSGQEWNVRPPSNMGPFVISPGNEIYVRSGPGTDHGVLTMLAGNADFVTTGITNDSQGREWWQVRLNDGTVGFLAGWVAQRIASEPEGDYHEDGADLDAVVKLSHIKIGSASGADGNVLNETYAFPSDTTRIYFTAITTSSRNSPVSGNLTMKWLTFDGAGIINERTESRHFSGANTTTYWINSSSGWIPGKYKVEVFVDGTFLGQSFYEISGSQHYREHATGPGARSQQPQVARTQQPATTRESAVVCILPSGDEKQLSRASCRSQGGSVFQ